MVCIVHNGAIVFGPAPWDYRSILAPLIEAGFDVLEGVLHGPDAAPVCPFPDRETTEPTPLADGYAILPVVEADEPSLEGQYLAGREPMILADRVELRPVWADIPPPPPPPSLEEVKTARRAEVDALRASRLQDGFTFVRDGTSHCLQTRGEDDRLNWLGVLSGCQALVMSGQGESLVDIRTAANDTLSIPASELMQILLGALSHQSAVFAAAWAIKDALSAITDESGGSASVQAYDITTGWPE